MMKYNVTVNGKKFEVEVEKVIESKDGARSPSKHIAEATVNPPKKYWEAPSSEASNEEEKVLSPMPGTITNLSITEGEKVEKGQVLCILEAMKMENEIMAPRDAVISKIVVSSGKPVKTGDVLIIIK